MGLPTYNCSEGLLKELPGILTQQGIRVAVLPVIDHHHAYRFRKGLGTVRFSGFVEKHDDTYRFHLTCGSNPIFWFFDMRLLSQIEEIALLHGAMRLESAELKVTAHK